MGHSRDLAKQDIGKGLPVLFIHGWTMSGTADANDFEPIFSRKSGYRRIYPDLPGMGDSAIGLAKSLESMLESLSVFVEQNILPSRFIVVGSSIGAYLARALVYKYADAVDGLLLRVPVIYPASEDRDVDPFKAAVTDEALLTSMSSDDRKLVEELSMPIQTQEYFDVFKEKAEKTWLPATAASDAKALDGIRCNADGYSLKSTLHGPNDPFLKPTLVVTGRQDSDVGYRDAWRLMDSYPRATFAVLDRAGHGLPVDETNAFGALVNDWLTRVEEMRKHEARKW